MQGVRSLSSSQLFTVCRPGQTSMSRSLKAVFWVFLLLFTLIYIGALFCASELGSNQKLKGVFGNIWISIFSHFKLMTLEQWVDICSLAMEVGAEQKGVDFFPDTRQVGGVKSLNAWSSG